MKNFVIQGSQYEHAKDYTAPHRVTVYPGTWGQTMTCDAPWECELPNGVVVSLRANESHTVPKVEWQDCTPEMQAYAKAHSKQGRAYLCGHPDHATCKTSRAYIPQRASDWSRPCRISWWQRRTRKAVTYSL